MNIIFFVASIWFWLDWSIDESKYKFYKLLLAILSTPTIIYQFYVLVSIWRYALQYILLNSINTIFPESITSLYNYKTKNRIVVFIKKGLYYDRGLITIKFNETFPIKKKIPRKYEMDYWINENTVEEHLESQEILMSNGIKQGFEKNGMLFGFDKLFTVSYGKRFENYYQLKESKRMNCNVFYKSENHIYKYNYKIVHRFTGRDNYVDSQYMDALVEIRDEGDLSDIRFIDFRYSAFVKMGYTYLVCLLQDVVEEVYFEGINLIGVGDY